MELEGGRSVPCSQCRQRMLVRVRSKGAEAYCPSCSSNILPLSYNAQQTSQYQHQGLRSRIRSFGSLVKNKIHNHHYGTITTTPSLNYQEPYGHYPMSRSSKRAVLCGISYNNQKQCKLKGTVNDVRNMKDLLITRFGYPKEYIRVLTEEETDQRYIPTKKNIVDSLKWLVSDCQSGDSILFFYSGHGLREPDFSNDEDDVFDEAICPVDFGQAGMIFDNDLNSLIVRPLERGVTLHAIVDACHSGTILELTNVYYSLEKKWKNYSPPSGVDKRTNGGLAISISACLDNQVAADTSVFTGKMNGALTYLLVEVLKILPGPTYGDLFDLIHESFDNVNSQGCLANTAILRRIFDHRLLQTPLLSSSDQFDVYKKHMFL